MSMASSTIAGVDRNGSDRAFCLNWAFILTTADSPAVGGWQCSCTDWVNSPFFSVTAALHFTLLFSPNKTSMYVISLSTYYIRIPAFIVH